jgi:predicted ATPase
VNESKLIVISGSPGAGKTTLIEELRRRGYTCSPEVARQLIQEQVASGGRAVPWDDREEYSKLMLLRSIDSWQESAAAQETIFFDRGIPDTLCYVRLVRLSSQLEQQVEEACRRYRYWPRVFLAPPWREIYETDTERKQDFAEAVRTYDLMARTYLDCGYQVVTLPLVSVEERAAFILQEISAG